mgnify:CR=1 FL=1
MLISLLCYLVTVAIFLVLVSIAHRFRLPTFGFQSFEVAVWCSFVWPYVVFIVPLGNDRDRIQSGQSVVGQVLSSRCIR